MTVVDSPEPAVEPFHRVSPLLVRARLVGEALVAVPILVAVVVLAVVLGMATWVLTAAVIVWLVVTVWYGIVAARQVPAMGYQCRADDLLVERGIMLRRSTLVPYGRMQLVEVSSGPVSRRFGLASVELHTASALTQASIDGLPRAEAEALRDALAARGESELAGL